MIEIKLSAYLAHQHRHVEHDCPSSRDGGYDRQGIGERLWKNEIRTWSHHQKLYHPWIFLWLCQTLLIEYLSETFELRGVVVKEWKGIWRKLAIHDQTIEIKWSAYLAHQHQHTVLIALLQETVDMTKESPQQGIQEQQWGRLSYTS